MQATLVFAVLLVVLFVVAYVTKRRFGALGLALSAGLLLSSSWSATLTPFIERQGIQLVAPPLTSVVTGALILLPAALLLFSGPTYNKKLGRIGGALAFAVFAFVLLLGPLSTALTFDETSFRIYHTLSSASNIIVVGGIGLALADTLVTRTPKGHRRRDEH